MGLALGIIGLIMSVAVIYFNVPYSRLRTDFKDYLIKSEDNTSKNIKTNKYALKELPQCIQKFYNYTGLSNKDKSKHVSFNVVDADFVNIEMKKTLKIDYSEHIFGNVPARFAFIDSSLYGVPFQGLDSFSDGEGGMKGVIAKNITLFNQKGEDMNRAALVTWLSEIIFMPSELLNGQVEVREIDKSSVKVSITYDNITVRGIYKFLDNGKLAEFTTDDRSMCYSDGRIEYKKWTAIYEDYVDKDGLLLPNRFKAKWHLDSGDMEYFDGKNVEFRFY